MTKSKRILTFVMAIIICVSVCLVNSSAYWVEYDTDPTTESLNSGTAYAWMYITNWAQETNTTDIEARTYAQGSDYDNIDNFAAVRVYVGLSVTLEDYSTLFKDESEISPFDAQFYASVGGNYFLNETDHYSIISFTSEHSVYITEIVEDDTGKREFVERQDGIDVSIGTSY